MKTRIEKNISSFFILSILIAIFLFSVQQAFAKVIINEIAWMGTDENPLEEWIELYNDDSQEVDLRNWKLYDSNALVISLTKKILPKSYYLIERITPTGQDPIPHLEDDAGGWGSDGLSNNGESLSLKDASGNTVDSVDGTDRWRINGSNNVVGIVRNKTKPTKTAQLVGTSWMTLPPTPRAKNENPTNQEGTGEGSHPTQAIRINEVLPNPSAKEDDGEYIELYNSGNQNIDLSGWKMRLSAWPIDPTKEPTEFIIKTNFNGSTPPAINAQGFFLLLRNKNSTLTLSNTGKMIELIDPSNAIVDSMHYEKAETDISFNYTANGWRKSQYTQGKENILNTIPETKEKNIPDTTYRDVLTPFSASGKDGDGDHIKYTWDFGDGHKSYKGETTHRYEEEGKYEGTLTVSDGTESTVTAFTIDVEKYDAPKIRMTTLLPNPDGKDTDAEYITLENRSKKSVDLLGWSIATGWKKLVNHPIRESFVIPKKSSRNITHASSAFTLPNEKGRIELRSPDGKTVQKLKYNLKGKSAEENARLVKEKGKKWEWIARQGTGNEEQGTIQTAVVPPAESAVIDEQEKQLKQDTERITLRKNRGEELLSTEQNPTEEMRRLISYGTDIETPIAVLALVPRVAGVTDEASQAEQNNIDEHFNMNALINHWLAEE